MKINKKSLISTIRLQIEIMLKSKCSILGFYILLFFVLINFSSNVVKYHGMDVMEMYHPMKLILLGENSGPYGYFFLQIYPLIVVLPAGFSLFSDKSSGEMILQSARVGKMKYFMAKIISVFIVTFIIFFIPLFLEIILNIISFPIQATGDPSNINVYEPVYKEMVSKYFLPGLYLENIFVYAIVNILGVCSISGILSMLVTAISAFTIKYKVFIFFPIFILLYGLAMLPGIIPGIKVSTNYFDYLWMYSVGTKSFVGVLIMSFLIAFISIMIMYIKGKKDLLK